MLIAATIEPAISQNARGDIAVNVPGPAVTSTSPTSSPPASIERIALRVTEPTSGASERTMRLVIAQVTAEPRAQAAPKAGAENVSRGLTRTVILWRHRGPRPDPRLLRLLLRPSRAWRPEDRTRHAQATAPPRLSRGEARRPGTARVQRLSRPMQRGQRRLRLSRRTPPLAPS